MYLDNAINRINKIEWKKSMVPVNKYKHHLGYEYLRRAAIFINKQEIKPINPIFLNVASVLGDEEERNYLELCRPETIAALENKCAQRNMVVFYLQLANYVDKYGAEEEYLQIYDPMIRMLEEGTFYEFRDGGLMVYNVGLYPLHGWYDNFLNASPKEI